ncbi:hypothetical protein J2Z65_006924 [Paenibacillus aceris]|uniref:Uncharacterized protein n=1 Tax=Paenibacillus aceris TaxID=869555 RepID=A0ABS4I9N8_9BACL|nr:hypothetical protein [Paenibacillus aceris]
MYLQLTIYAGFKWFIVIYAENSFKYYVIFYTVQNIHLEYVNAIGKYGLKAYNVEGFVMNNVSFVSRLDEDY